MATTEETERLGKSMMLSMDVSQIPNHVKNDIAAATFHSVQKFLQQPGGKQTLDARIKANKELSHRQ